MPQVGGLLGVLAPGLGLLALGCVLLVWGAEEFVEHVAEVARLVGLPTLALAVLLAGAEPEELATAVIAGAQGHPVLAATDAIGANITMLTLGLGLALLVQPLTVTSTLRRYAVVAALAGVLAAAALWDGHVHRWEGAVLVAAFVAVVAGIWRTQRRPLAFGELAERPLSRGADTETTTETGTQVADPETATQAGTQAGTQGADVRVAAQSDDSDDRVGSPLPAEAERGSRADRPRGSGRRAVVMLLAGLAALVFGGALAVDGASRIAAAAGLGEHATGLSALALATSAEVLALVVAARRHDLDTVAVGGMLGAILYNATLTLGVSALVAPLEAPGLTAAAVLAAALPLAVLVAGLAGRRFVRPVGAILGAGYPLYLWAVFARWL